MTTNKMNTTLVTAGRKKRYTQGGVNTIIQRASSLIFETIEHKKYATAHRHQKELFYGRRGTLTHFSLQEAMSEIENGAGCSLYPCGVAAISTSILAFVQSGDHVLISGSVYEATRFFCEQVLNRFNVNVTFFDHSMGVDVVSLLQQNTKVIFFESPGSLTMEVQDIPNIIKKIRDKNKEIVVITDNTWSAGIFFNALEKDVDISVQSGTKYLAGHSDIMMGTSVANKRCWDQLREYSYLLGQTIDSDTAYIISRGLRTLGARLNQHQESALIIAKWLQDRPEVECVNHPALKGSPGHNFWKRDFTGSSGLFSFFLKTVLTEEQLSNYLNSFKLFKMAYSWGGYESLIIPNQPNDLKKIRPKETVYFDGTLIRLHIGLEHVQDLINDLSAGFDRLKI
ncbi:cystathionine beta-lyase [Candidatus Tachikawaea gelatinosa]|uniref:Cystathionine beta-lyase n=1 Tax=Candidatus Tachikawaea gelatinosa TaxID=1410383 RepID=A0A090ARV8_9ENTR|nr:cystathionine beta-lyase [Candidatus Tachikawaea gelatinosa]BAP58560.1 cystathionine beta-lyase [Candidatus Tachikawaea gelatinosa]